MTITPLAVLKEARNLLADPKAWTQDTAARDSAGRPVATTDPDAQCFCTLGAMARAVQNLTNGQHTEESDEAWREADYQLRVTLGEPWGKCVPVFNDSPRTTHQDVLDLFDRTIREAEKMEA